MSSRRASVKSRSTTVVGSARFAPDGETVVYTERRGNGQPRLLITRLDSAGVTPLPVQNAYLFGISREAEMLVALKPQMNGFNVNGTLVRLPLLGGAPRVSPSGDQVAFFAWPIKEDDRGTVVIVDRTGRQQTIAGPYEAVRGLAWTPDGREVWFGAASAGTDYEIRAAGRDRPERRVYSSPAGLLLYDIARDGRALVAQYDRTVHIELTSEGDPRPHNVSWRNGSFVRDISRDGRTVLMSYFGQGSSTNYDVYVRVVDEADATKIGEGQPQQFSPDERSVLSVVHGPPSRVLIQPIGAGEPTTVSTGQVLVTDAR